MPRRCSPDFLTLFQFRNQSITYPRRRPSIRMLIHRIEALGYEVIILPQDIEWGDIPQEYSAIVVLSDCSHQLLLIEPLPCHCCRLMRSGIIRGSYDDG